MCKREKNHSKNHLTKSSQIKNPKFKELRIVLHRIPLEELSAYKKEQQAIPRNTAQKTKQKNTIEHRRIVNEQVNVQLQQNAIQEIALMDDDGAIHIENNTDANAQVERERLEREANQAPLPAFDEREETGNENDNVERNAQQQELQQARGEQVIPRKMGDVCKKPGELNLKSGCGRKLEKMETPI